VLFVRGKLFGNAERHILTDAEMRKEIGILCEIPNGSLMHWTRRRKEREVAESNVSVVRFLDSSDAGEHSALSSTGNPEQSQRVSLSQL
jgi:hypothetical protein